MEHMFEEIRSCFKFDCLSSDSKLVVKYNENIDKQYCHQDNSNPWITVITEDLHYLPEFQSKYEYAPNSCILKDNIFDYAKARSLGYYVECDSNYCFVFQKK